MNDRIVSGKPHEEDHNLDTNLRPRNLETYVGQENIKSTLSISIQAALQREEPLDHLLLYGPPGLGKTTLAILLPPKWERESKLHPAPQLNAPETWWQF